LLYNTDDTELCAVRHLSAEVKEEWQELDELKPEPSSPAAAAERRDQLLEMVYQIVPYLMQHNAEAEACDVLMEMERLDLLQQYVDRSAFPRVCLYLRRSLHSLFMVFVFIKLCHYFSSAVLCEVVKIRVFQT